MSESEHKYFEVCYSDGRTVDSVTVSGRRLLDENVLGLARYEQIRQLVADGPPGTFFKANGVLVFRSR